MDQSWRVGHGDGGRHQALKRAGTWSPGGTSDTGGGPLRQGRLDGVVGTGREGRPTAWMTAQCAESLILALHTE